MDRKKVIHMATRRRQRRRSGNQMRGMMQDVMMGTVAIAGIGAISNMVKK